MNFIFYEDFINSLLGFPSFSLSKSLSMCSYDQRELRGKVLSLLAHKNKSELVIW